MIQIQVIVEYIREPHSCENCSGIDPASCLFAPRPTIRLTANKLEREDASDEEREMAGAIEGVHRGIFEMIAKQNGDVVEEIRG